MSYRAILVHVNESRHVQQCIDVAARVACAGSAHLIGAACTGTRTPSGIVDPALPAFTYSLEMVQERVGPALPAFDAGVRRIGLASFEARLIAGESGEMISLLARHCDLAVLGQTDADDPAPLVSRDFPEHVTMHCGRPVLVVPVMADDLGSDVIVMGAYGHQRLRELLLGGVTRPILEAMTVPTLISH